jgi:C-terminal peptidase prc
MRGLSAWCTSLAAAAALTLALPANSRPAPVPADTSSAAGANLRAEALNYAHQLLQIIARIEIDYVRPVTRAELAEAAISGLYEVARQPVPSSLKHDLQRTDDGELLGLLVRTREQLGNLDALRGNRALFVSLRALPRVMDPYCGVVGPQEFRYLEMPEGMLATGLELAGVSAQPIQGIGAGGAMIRGEIVLTDPSGGPKGPVRVQNVIPGSPAQRAGLRPNDLIVKLGGQPPESPAYARLLRRLLPPQPGMPVETHTGPGDHTRLMVLRPGQAEALEVSLSPAPFRPESVFGARRRTDGTWNFMLDPSDGIGYIRLGAIDRYYTLPAFRDALKSLQGQSVRGLVLDLRWCPSGFLQQSATITRLMLPAEAQVAIQRKRNGPEEPVLIDPTGLAGPYLDFPMVVLVGRETSGAGEMIAAALQDSGRAIIAGQRSVGKSTIQTDLSPYGIPFKLTSATFVRPSGKNLQRFPDSKPTDDWGIRPDAGRELPMTAESGRKLKEWWVLQTLRPAESTEVLPLDDPENDPQRHAAVQMVRELLKKP